MEVAFQPGVEGQWDLMGDARRGPRNTRPPSSTAEVGRRQSAAW